jgi:hypothetical protein
MGGVVVWLGCCGAAMLRLCSDEGLTERPALVSWAGLLSHQGLSSVALLGVVCPFQQAGSQRIQ